MFLYTFIMEYLGGTYVSQIFAMNEIRAMHKWVRELDVKDINNFTELDKKNIIREGFIEGEPNALKGCKNVWCFTIRPKKALAIVNIIKTEVNTDTY